MNGTGCIHNKPCKKQDPNTHKNAPAHQDPNKYSPSTSKSGQYESVEGCPMNRHTCREEGANAQDDGEQGENDRNAIAVRYIVNADSGCLAYPSAGYREDCADNGASRQVGHWRCARCTTPRSAVGLPRLPKGGERNGRRRRSKPFCTDGQARSLYQIQSYCQCDECQAQSHM